MGSGYSDCYMEVTQTTYFGKDASRECVLCLTRGEAFVFQRKVNKLTCLYLESIQHCFSEALLGQEVLLGQKALLR